MLKFENKYFIYDQPEKINIKNLIRKTLYPIKNLLLKIMVYSLKIKHSEKKIKVSICAIFRDESSILEEWLNYHKIIGIEHFYLYNNFSEDNYKEILQPYINNEEVTLIEWPYKKSQMQAYEDCVRNFSKDTEWIGFIDLDEFIVPSNPYYNIYDFLKQFNEKTAFLVLYWKYFGSSGYIKRNPLSLVTETFTSCWSKYSNIGKFFYNTNFDYYAKEELQKGFMHYRWGSYNDKMIPPMNVFGNFLIWNINKVNKDIFPIQINHYVIKSYDEYIEKKAKRGGGIHDVQTGFHDTQYFWDHENLCECKDFKIYKYITKLKLSLNK